MSLGSGLPFTIRLGTHLTILSPENRDLRQLLWHRLMQMRTGLGTDLGSPTF
jgi:hypothetical protein